jgi:hypothetical protein
MTVDIEAGGALATAALTAKTIDAHSAATGEGHPTICANCGAALVGAYCHACGQTAHVHRSIWHMVEEGLHGVLHFDSKTWRTLPLLIARPGLLTRRYIDGQRVRYVSPLALFLFMIFLMFFVVSSVTKSDSSQATPGQVASSREELVTELEQARMAVREATAAVAAAKDEDEREEAAEQLEEAQAEERAAAAVVALFDKAATNAQTGQTTALTPEELSTLTGWNFASAKASGVLKHIKDNPELYLYKLKNTAYKFAFMLIPISLPFLWLMFFWRRDVRTYDHMVFSMYSLSFMSLLFVIIALATTTPLTQRLVPFLVLIPPVHMFVHLRGTYGLSKRSALWRTFALLISAGTVFGLFMALVAVISYV